MSFIMRVLLKINNMYWIDARNQSYVIFIADSAWILYDN